MSLNFHSSEITHILKSDAIEYVFLYSFEKDAVHLLNKHCMKSHILKSDAIEYVFLYSIEKDAVHLLNKHCMKSQKVYI